MNINITTKNLELTPAISGHIEKKMAMIEKLIKKPVARGAASLDFEVARTTKHHKKGAVYYAEANLLLVGHKIRAEQTGENIYQAIDAVKQLLKQEISKHKEKYPKLLA